MRVWIDQGLCSADGLCSETVPSVFAMGDDGVAHVLLPDGSLGTAVKRWHWYRRGRRGACSGPRQTAPPTASSSRPDGALQPA